MTHRERAKQLIDSKWFDMPNRVAMEIYIANEFANLESDLLKRASDAVIAALQSVQEREDG